MIENWMGQTRNPTVSPPKSLTDQIYEYLKESILINEIEAGEHLVEAKLSEFFGASRTPIREAFRRLEQEGLVGRLTKGGVRVAPLEEDTLKQVLSIRLVLEAYAADIACENITQEELDQLTRIRNQADFYLSSTEKLSKEQIREIWKLNTLFHDTILKTTGNEHLIKIMGQLRQIVQRFRILSHFEKENRAHSWQEHELMIHHLKEKDKEALKRVWREHLENAASAALETLALRKQAQGIKKQKLR